MTVEPTSGIYSLLTRLLSVRDGCRRLRTNGRELQLTDWTGSRSTWWSVLSSPGTLCSLTGTRRFFTGTRCFFPSNLVVLSSLRKRWNEFASTAKKVRRATIYLFCLFKNIRPIVIILTLGIYQRCVKISYENGESIRAVNWNKTVVQQNWNALK